MKRLVAGLLVLAATVALPGVARGAATDTKVQLLAINDLHGHLAANTPGTIQVGCCNPVPATGTRTGWTPRTVPAGGIAYLATHIKQLRAENPNSLTVAAGDMIGASPLVSALFHDEPAIEALNYIGLDVSGVGNHEFDEGIDELHRMRYGDQAGGDGCHPVDGCQDGTPFGGSLFEWLAANVVYAGTDMTVLPPYEIHKAGNAKIAFIGLTFEGTPTVVTPAGVAGLEFRPEVPTINALVDRLRHEHGVKAFVVLLHQGGTQRPPSAPAASDPPPADAFMNVDRCVNFNGPEITSIAEGLDPRVSAIVTAHTHQPYVCRIADKVVTSAASFGRVVTEIELTIDHQSKRVTEVSADNHVVTQNVPQDAGAKAILDKYSAIAAPLANRVVGRITGDIRSARDTPSGQNSAGEQPMGDVIADAMLEATRAADFGGAVAAFMNAGGVRAGLLYNQISGGEQPGEVTYGEAFAVQPFGNSLVVKTCTGRQIYNLLNQQFNNPSTGSNRIMLPSAGVRYQWTSTGGARVIEGSLTFDGVPVDPTASYRIAVNNFMADGGDGFTALTTCTEPLGGEVDLDAFVRYLGARSPLSPPALNRIQRVG